MKGKPMKKRHIWVFCFLIPFLMGISESDCDGGRTSYSSQGKTQKYEAQFTEDQQGRLIKATPPPQLKHSLERENLSKRLTRFNQPSKISYIYLIDFGKVMAYYTIKGKVSSVNSKLTTGEQLVKAPYYDADGGPGGNLSLVVESPQLDGSYGTNGDAIFFFTTEDVYVEWSGRYMLCDEPLQLSTPPTLVMEIKEK